ncbi:MAG: hypothetical protein S4CHLAM6_11210 [Chlamydiae bacterium]|nr:hypothetical protein [Chlamydiota bacterium]
MKGLNRFFILLVAFVCATSQLFAETSNNFAIQISDLLDTTNQKDLWAVREWLRTKRVALNNKLGDFSLSGDVKTQWRNVHQHLGGINITGGINSPSGWNNNLYEVEFRLYFDYKADKTWASVKLDYDEAAGLFSGQSNNLALVRANMGYHLFDDGNMRLDVLVGRQRAYELYNSQIQFNSTLDGFTGMYSLGLDGLGDFNLHAGGYIFNALASHPVWMVQCGLHDIFDTGLYLEYSFVDWHKNTSSTPVTNVATGNSTFLGSETWAFRNNEFILGYAFNPEIFGRDVRLFGGILWNALARPRSMNRLSGRDVDSTQALAGWIALQLGSVQRAGDWAFQAQWQVVQPYAVPDWDMAGMGRGNGSDSTLFGFATFSKVTNLSGNGNANYNGWELDLLYSVTNELVLDLRYQRALPTTSSVGLESSYTNVVLAAVYGF